MRLFTAVDLPTDIRARLALLLDQLNLLAKLQWTAPEKLHITTTFIGEWPEARLEELHAVLGKVTSDSFQISVRGVRWMNKRVLCAGIEETTALATLASSTGAALAGIGVPIEDRPYHPHLTLARRKHPGRVAQLDQVVAELSSSDFGMFTATQFGLFLSHGGKYTQIKDYVLGS
jgi:2'-5' RNA ligase